MPSRCGCRSRRQVRGQFSSALAFPEKALAAIEQALARGANEQAIVEGIKEISLLLARHFPPRLGGRNELPDRPMVL